MIFFLPQSGKNRVIFFYTKKMRENIGKTFFYMLINIIFFRYRNCHFSPQDEYVVLHIFLHKRHAFYLEALCRVKRRSLSDDLFLINFIKPQKTTRVANGEEEEKQLKFGYLSR